MSARLTIPTNFQMSNVLDVGVFGDAEDRGRHHLLGGAAVGIGQHVVLADQADNHAVMDYDWHSADPMLMEDRRNAAERFVGVNDDDRSRHDCSHGRHYRKPRHRLELSRVFTTLVQLCGYEAAMKLTRKSTGPRSR
jgi:hypothetical protein